MAKRGYSIDGWGLGPRVAELWATGNRGRTVAKLITGEVNRICRENEQEPPTIEALTMAVTRYMQTDPGDRRTKQARAQGAVVEKVEEQAIQIVQAQVDAAQTLHKYVERIDAEVTRIQSVMEIDAETGKPTLPAFRDYYTALASMSKEMRGWITLLVDIKDRLWQHEQYEKAYTIILATIKQECPSELWWAITKRLREDPAVASALRGMGGGG